MFYYFNRLITKIINKKPTKKHNAKMLLFQLSDPDLARKNVANVNNWSRIFYISNLTLKTHFGKANKVWFSKEVPQHTILPLQLSLLKSVSCPEKSPETQLSFC